MRRRKVVRGLFFNIDNIKALTIALIIFLIASILFIPAIVYVAMITDFRGDEFMGLIVLLALAILTWVCLAITVIEFMAIRKMKEKEK